MSAVRTKLNLNWCCEIHIELGFLIWLFWYGCSCKTRKLEIVFSLINIENKEMLEQILKYFRELHKKDSDYKGFINKLITVQWKSTINVSPIWG